MLNPLYEQIKVEFEVEFTETDWGYYADLLEQDIIKFLSPWAFEDGKDIVFGGKIHRSVILNFVEERDYVDFVAEFKMYHITKNAAGVATPKEVEEAYPTTARSILVSNDTHKINEIVTCK